MMSILRYVYTTTRRFPPATETQRDEARLVRRIRIFTSEGKVVL